MTRRWYRALPALAAGLLLAPAVLAPPHGAGARPAAAPVAAPSVPCVYAVQQGGTGSTLTFGPGAGITQPIGVVCNVAACSLQLDQPYYSYGLLRIVQWDPITLAPDPTTVALRTRSFGVSELIQNHVRADFYPPIVTRQLPHLAEAPRALIAVDYRSADPWSSQTVHYESPGAEATPAAVQYSSGGVRSPFPGAHPVLSHLVCGSDPNLQGSYVCQSVMTTDAILDTSSYEVIQRFRVPYETRLGWLELAFGTQPGWPLVPGSVAILGCVDPAFPPVDLSALLVQAPFHPITYGAFATWDSHYDFDQQITLVPGQDYWLLAQVAHAYPLHARALTGTESDDFTANIGTLHRRTGASGPWLPLPGKALSFRVIGEPLGVLGVPRPGPPKTALALRVTPNPSRGAAFVNWSGASGPVRFEVVDACGRLVARGSGAGSREGRWTWRGSGDDGRALPAGVFFVRATDGAGRVAVERVVRVR